MVKFYQIVVKKVEKFYVNKRPLDVVFLKKVCMNKKYIVKENTEFNEIINTGNKISNNEFIIFYKNKKEQTPKFGITAPKKIGNAIIRNKCKRQLRNMVISNNLLFKNYNNYIIIIRKGFLINSFKENEKSLINLIGGLNEQ